MWMRRREGGIGFSIFLYVIGAILTFALVHLRLHASTIPTRRPLKRRRRGRPVPPHGFHASLLGESGPNDVRFYWY
jgi:hypothetical protein